MPATYSESMTDRTNFTKAMLERMMALKREGKTSREILASMQAEYGAPRYVSEVNSELHFLSQGPNIAQWNYAMEERIKTYTQQGMDSKDITTELFHEFAKPDYWQETYRKIQQMKLQGKIA